MTSESTAVVQRRSAQNRVVEAPKKNKKGLVLSELAAKAIEAGYKSPLESFQNVVYQCLDHTPDIEQGAGTMRYSLKK